MKHIHRKGNGRTKREWYSVQWNYLRNGIPKNKERNHGTKNKHLASSWDGIASLLL